MTLKSSGRRSGWLWVGSLVLLLFVSVGFFRMYGGAKLEPEHLQAAMLEEIRLATEAEIAIFDHLEDVHPAWLDRKARRAGLSPEVMAWGETLRAHFLAAQAAGEIRGGTFAHSVSLPFIHQLRFTSQLFANHAQQFGFEPQEIVEFGNFFAGAVLVSPEHIMGLACDQSIVRAAHAYGKRLPDSKVRRALLAELAEHCRIGVQVNWYGWLQEPVPRTEEWLFRRRFAALGRTGEYVPQLVGIETSIARFFGQTEELEKAASEAFRLGPQIKLYQKIRWSLEDTTE